MSPAAVQRSLSVVVPAYNEVRRLGLTLDTVLAWCTGRFAPLELIVVDDGSSDGTSRVAAERASAGAPVRVLKNDLNRGKGYSVRRGILEAQNELVLFSDADLSTPIEELEKLLAHLDHAQVVIGSRSIKGSRVEVRQPLFRMLMGKTFNKIVRVVLGTRLNDTQCGFKLFSRDAAREAFSRATVDGFAFDAEVLLIAERLGYRIQEVPVRWLNSPASTVHPVKDSARMLRDVLRVRWRHRTLAAQVRRSGEASPKGI